MNPNIEISLKSLSKILKISRKWKKHAKSFCADYNRVQDEMSELRENFNNSLKVNSELHKEVRQAKETIELDYKTITALRKQLTEAQETIDVLRQEVTEQIRKREAMYDRKRAEEAILALRDAATIVWRHNIDDLSIRIALRTILHPWLPEVHKAVPTEIETQDIPKVEEKDE